MILGANQFGKLTTSGLNRIKVVHYLGLFFAPFFPAIFQLAEGRIGEYSSGRRRNGIRVAPLFAS